MMHCDTITEDVVELCVLLRDLDMKLKSKAQKVYEFFLVVYILIVHSGFPLPPGTTNKEQIAMITFIERNRGEKQTTD